MASNNIALLQVKKNQRNLLKHCQGISIEGQKIDKCQSYDKGHGRLETRQYSIFRYKPIGNCHWDQYIKTVVKVFRERSCYDTSKKAYIPSNEVSYYICSSDLPASVIAEAIRSHWAIENSNHYVRDVTMYEDASRMRINPDIFCTLRSFALNLIRANGSTNIRSTRYQNALSLGMLLSYSYL